MIQEALPHLPSDDGKVRTNTQNYSPDVESAEVESKTSTLIAFPGANRTLPEWRKQLSQRVREVQERKAREAAEELAAAQEAGLVTCALPSGQLELVPDLESPVVNPIVTKALERLERARRGDFPSQAAAAVAPALEPDLEPVVETKPKLTVVAPPAPAPEPVEAIAEEIIAIAPEPIIEEAPPSPAPITEEIEPAEMIVAREVDERGFARAIETAIVEPESETMRPDRKPIRVISDNDIALSYLETCLGVPALASDTRSDLAGLPRRFCSGIFDLLLVAVMVSPAAAAIYYSGANWKDPSIIGWMSGIFAFTMFAYLTICTAMTGRTLSMRIFRMRTIDLRTGLIPTGGQSITRALTYVFALALLGLGIVYAVVDPDKRAVHDKLSKTIVIRT